MQAENGRFTAAPQRYEFHRSPEHSVNNFHKNQ